MTPDSPDPDRLRCWAEIDAAALRHNACVAGRLAGGGPECVMAVVKADAYGHSLPLVARALREDIGSFAVASFAEAMDVKQHAKRAGTGSEVPVYILSPALPAEVPDIVRHGFIPAISTVTEVRQFAAASQVKSTAVHVVVDTGMGRMGALPEQAAAVLDAVRTSGVLTLDSVSSHFPCADEDGDFTSRQEEEFRRLTAHWQGEFGPFRTHIANSAAILQYPRLPHEIVRAGLMLYGMSPLPEHESLLRPVLTWKARIALVRNLPAGWGISYGRSFITPRPMTVAAIAAGYGDGYPRQVSGRGAAVLVRGRRCAILGRVTMDQIIIDVSDLTPAPIPGEEAVLLGRQGSDAITAREIAAQAGTIAWHVFTGITDRTARLPAADVFLFAFRRAGGANCDENVTVTRSKVCPSCHTRPSPRIQPLMISLQKFFGKDDNFFTLLEASAKEGRTSIQALNRMLLKPQSVPDLNAFHKAKETDKRITDQINEALVSSFVTQLEKEDIEVLSHALYRIPKTVEKFASRFIISGPVVRDVDFARHIALLDAATNQVVSLVAMLRTLGAGKIHEAKRLNAALQQIEGDADALQLEMLRDLYSGKHDPIRVIALRDLFELLEVVVDRCRDAGNIVTHIVLKNA